MHVSLSEILVVLLVAVLVIKPEHLPNAASILGRWIKWFRRTTAKLKHDIEQPFEQLTIQKEKNGVSSNKAPE